MAKLVFFVLLLLAPLGCSTLPAVQAVKDGRIALKASEQDVVAAAGKPDLILARRGVETFYYKRSDTLAVSVSVHRGKVVAFDDSDKWPAGAAKASDAADKPVATGKVRVGMPEDALIKALEKPNGVTAKDGQETLHWLTDDEVDSVVTLSGGKVGGYWDRPVSKFTQNLPTADRDNATTSGKIRVGMTAGDVEKALGAADGKAGGKGVTVHRYESDPVFGDHIVYSVGFKDDKVFDLFLFNVTRDEDQKEEEAARRVAAEGEKRSQEAESSILSFLDNPLVKAALAMGVSAATQGSTPRVGTKSVESRESRELEINGTKYRGGPALGQPCGLDGPGCPDGYKCVIVTSRSGMCAQ